MNIHSSAILFVASGIALATHTVEAKTTLPVLVLDPPFSPSSSSSSSSVSSSSSSSSSSSDDHGGGGTPCRRLARHLEACADVEYDLSVSVSGAHLALTGAPRCGGSRSLRRSGSDDRSSACEACPPVVLHTVTVDAAGDAEIDIDGGEQFLQKAFHTVPPEHLERGFESLWLGTFGLNRIVEVYDDTPVRNNTYSLLGNNCASFLIAVGRKLGLNPTDRRIVTFVSKHLSRQPKILGALSRHPELRSLLESHDTEDAVVVQEFVATYIHDRASTALDTAEPGDRRLDVCD